MARGRQGTGVQPLKTAIRVRFTWQGKRRVETLDLAPTPGNIKAAERMMAKLKREIETGVFDYAATFPSSHSVTVTGFKSHADTWLASVTAEKSTKQGYTYAINEVWGPAFGERALESIKPSEIRKIMAEMATRVTGKTVNNVMIPLRQIFAAALDDELIEKKPTENIVGLKHQLAKPDPFERHEMESILAHIASRYNPQVLNWYEIAFGTGLRPSEQIAVHWQDVDWNRQTIRIERAKVRGVVKGTKTDRVRDVELTSRMIAALKRQKVHSFMRGPDNAIFLNPLTQNPWADVDAQREAYFHPTLKALGIRKRDAYQTRHTFATLSLMAGINIAYIARQLGHTNAGMLLKHYGKWIDGADMGREKSKLEALFGHELVTVGGKANDLN